jgi:hypothetical protein
VSDTYYRELARKRARRWWMATAAAIVIILTLLGLRGLLYDSCTRSYDRSPEAVVRTYVNAVKSGAVLVAQECWEHQAYFDLEAGCSEICLSRAFGAQFDVVDLSIGGQYLTPDVRTNLLAKLTVSCTGKEEGHTGEILLDTVGSNLPWRHWKIIHSTFGGTTAEPWCK